MSKARTLASTVSTGAVLADGTINAAEIGSLTLPTGGDIVGTTSTQTLTDKTIAFADNTLTGVVPTSAIGVTVQPYDSNLEAFVNTFTLPTTDGIPDQVLKTDGSGTLSFVTASSGTSTAKAYFFTSF